MSSDVNPGGEVGESDLGTGHCTVFLHAEKFTSTVSSQIFLLQIGEYFVTTVLMDGRCKYELKSRDSVHSHDTTTASNLYT